MSERRHPIELAAITIDCADAVAMSRFYVEALDGVLERTYSGGAWIRIGELLILIREVPGYLAPTWPGDGVPMQMHFEFWADDIVETQDFLQSFGATTPEFQPDREHGNLVMLDPAGHPFCIGVRM